MLRYRCILLVMAIVAVLLSLNGCAHRTPSYDQRSEGVVEVIIEPEGLLPNELRLGIFDFIDATKIEGLGLNMAQQVYRNLLQRQFVQVIEEVHQDPLNIEHALAVGREAGYDLIVVGEVNEFMYGGFSADSQVTLSLRILDPKADVTLWYLTGTMVDEPRTFLDYVLFWRTSEEATSPYDLSSILLEQMIEIIDAQRRSGIIE